VYSKTVVLWSCCIIASTQDGIVKPARKEKVRVKPIMIKITRGFLRLRLLLLMIVVNKER